MTVPNLLQQLGPNFDYESLRQAVDNGAFKGRPDMEDTARQLVFSHDALNNTSARIAQVDAAAAAQPNVSVPSDENAPKENNFIGDIKEVAKSIVAAATLATNPGAVLTAANTPGETQALGGVGDIIKRAGQIAQEFAYQGSGGLIKAPVLDTPQAQHMWNMTVKPVTFLGAQIAQGEAAVRLLGWVTKVPAGLPLMQKIPSIMKEIGIGAATGASLGAMDPNSGDRSTAALHGMIFGMIVAPAVAGVAAGINLKGTLNMAKNISDDALPAIRDAIIKSGIDIAPDASKFDVAKIVMKNLNAIKQGKDLASISAQLLSRQQYIADAIYAGSNLTTDDERILGGIFRNNPSGISVVSGLEADPTGTVTNVSQKLGLTIMHTQAARKGGSFDALIGRPKYIYDDFSATTKETQKVTKGLADIGKAAEKDIRTPKSNESLLLADGTAIRGGIDYAGLAQKFKIQVPSINGEAAPAEALKTRGRFIKMVVEGSRDKPSLRIELPSAITQEQFNALGRAADAVKFERVTIVNAAGNESILQKPLGAQIQDAISKVHSPKAVAAPFDEKTISMFEKYGMFPGQAALLPDGSPVSILSRRGKQVTIIDPLLNTKVRTTMDQLTMLPTSLTNEFQPSNLFNSALTEDEMKAFVKLRMGLSQKLAQPIETYSQLQKFAGSRGFFLDKGKGGVYRLEHIGDGEVLEFDGKKAVINHLRNISSPMPELTPPEMQKWLGLNGNLGVINGNGMPPNFGELIPPRPDILFEHIGEELRGRGLGLGSVIKPSRGLFLDMDKDSKGLTEFFRHFENLQSGYVGRNNFIEAWSKGTIPGMPKGVKPLHAIAEMDDGSVDWDRVTAIMEAGDNIVEGESALERRIAGEMRKWYDPMFTSGGIEAEYLTNYAPHWRMTNGKYGNQPIDIWRAEGNDLSQLPKGAELLADYYRDGTLDIYDTHAMRVATNYLRAVANKRFTAEAWNQARDYAILLNSNPATRPYVGPFKNFLLALKGAEFGYQTKMVSETLQSLLESLPGAGTVDPRGVDKLTNYLLGIMYSSVMGARPALALRNAIQPLLMTWPIIGGGREGFMEAVGRALTTEGKNAAIADRAIDASSHSFAHFEEIQRVLPEALERANNAGMYFYDRADQFTRSVSYWAGRLRAEKALVEFSEAAQKGELSASDALKLRRKLIKDSGMHIQDPQIQAEFLRRATIDPTGAAGFAGKQLSDVTNFLYGRGMQARWMRSIPGRFLGQFGSWSMWYIDYIRRITSNMVRNGYAGEAASFLARHALVNAAILYAGYDKLHVDLSRWVAYNSMFYSGGPALQIVAGASTLMRGLGSEASMAQDPLAQSRVTEGTQMIKQTLPNFVPFYYATRDMIRLAHAQTPVEAIAAALSTRPTRRYQLDRSMNIIMGGENQFTSSSPALEDMLNELATGNQNGQVVDLDYIDQLISKGAIGNQAASSPQTARAEAPSSTSSGPTAGPPSLSPVQQGLAQPHPAPNEVVKPAVSKPIRNY